jgi:predicted choloylglycine hydrolase
MRPIAAEGTPYEIGYAIGSHAGDLVREAVGAICRFDLGDPDIDARLAAIEERLSVALPDVLDEAAGLADAVGIDRRVALSLSVCTDLDGRLPSCCSLVGALGDSGPLVGKNLDTAPEMRHIQVVERLAPRRGLAFAHLTTAGAMWTDGGVNEAGLALVNASVRSAESSPDGLPDGILAREILARCADVPTAVEFAGARTFRSLGENLLLADASGRVAVIEKLPGGQAVREDAVAACNHALNPTLAPLMEAGDPVRANSARRYERLTRELGSRGEWTLEQIGALLAQHSDGICQHGEDELWTVASLVLAPRSLRIWVAGGPPCEEAFEEVLADLGPRTVIGAVE